MNDYKHIPNNSFGNRQLDDVDDIPYEYPNWIITDTRFPNEVNAVKLKDGVNIRIERDDYVFKVRNGLVIRVDNPNVVSEDTHESETALDDYSFDYVVFTNDGSIENLVMQVKDFLIQKQLLK